MAVRRREVEAAAMPIGLLLGQQEGSSRMGVAYRTEVLGTFDRPSCGLCWECPDRLSFLATPKWLACSESSGAATLLLP